MTIVASNSLTISNVNDGTITHVAYANIEFLCKERSNFTLSEVSLVRYGSDSRWAYKEFQAGTYTATTTLWGSDPASGTEKNVELVSEFSTSNSIDTTHIGVYVDFVESDSVDPSKYNWTLVKGADGTQGTPGKAGADGKTPYFHTAWSNSVDGTLDFNPDYKSAVGLDVLNVTSWAKNTSMSNSNYTFVSNADRSFKVTGKGTGGYEVLSKSFPAKVGDKLRFTVRYTNRLAFALYNSYGLQFVVNNSYTESVTSTSKIVLPNEITVSTEYQLEYTATTSNVWMQLNFGGVADSAQVDFDVKIEVENLTNPVKYAYIGTYSDYTATDSTNPSAYTWSLIRGNDGAAGPPGTSAINIDLSNKSYNFLANLEVSDSGSVMQAVAGSTTTTFTALQGTTAINITALTCTTILPTGMTVSIGTLNALSVVVTISVDNTMITPNGVLNFSITAGGVTTTKSFSYSLAINDLTVINLAAINSNLGNVKNIYSHYNGSDGGTYSGTIEINDENIKITATNDNNSNEVSKTQMNGENGIWHSTKLQKTNSPGVYVLSNWSLTGATLSFESQQSDLTYPNGYSYASYGIDVHARNIVGDSISQTNDVRTWTPITLNNVTSAVLMYKIINGIIHLNGQGNWGSFTANQSKTVATLPAALCPTRTVNKIITTQNSNNNDKPMELQIQEGGNINIWSMPASTSGRYGGFEESYPLG